MIKVAFFNDKKAVGKSTITLLTAKMFRSLFERAEEQINIYIFDLSQKKDNTSLAYKYEQEGCENSLFNIKYILNYEEFKMQENSFKENDIAFFDLQELSPDSINFLINSHYLFIIGDNPKEFSLDKEVYTLFHNASKEASSQIKDIFFLQNKIVNEDLEAQNINIIKGLEQLPTPYQLENTKIKGSSVPIQIQRLATQVYKILYDNENQYILE